MKIHLISIEDGITATGFRRIAAYIEKLNPDTRVFYVGADRYLSLSKLFTRKIGDASKLGPAEIDEIASGIAAADLVAFSSMTGDSSLTKALARRIHEINPRAYTMWGGIHPIMCPEDALGDHFDAICRGEGEFAIDEFLRHFESGSDFTHLAGFWFRKRGSGDITRNPTRPLMSSSDLSTLPFPKYGGEERIYKKGRGFVPATRSDYLANNGLGYPTIWTIGCPLHCTYCGNTVFVANDRNYRKIRHSGIDHIIGEVSCARILHPHIRTILFYDDSFLAIPLHELTDFAEQWRSKVGLPFCIFGVVPSYVQREKIEVLTWAGMNRVRMGIESGSERVLNFYGRPTPVPLIEKAAETLARFKPYHINPTYDIIVDNPIESRQDIIDTLELVYRLPRPFSLGIFSLRAIPNTTLEDQLRKHGFRLKRIDENYRALRPTFSNLLLCLLMVWRPPRQVFVRLLKKVRGCDEPQKSYSILMQLVRIPWLILQALRHLKHGEFTAITGRSGYFLWRLGMLPLIRKISVRGFRPAAEAYTRIAGKRS